MFKCVSGSLDFLSFAHQSVMRIWIGLLAGLLITSTEAASLKETLDKVWARNPKAQALEMRREEIVAKSVIAEGWLAGAPLAGASLRTDQWNENRGLREWESDLEIPLWFPGEREARRRLAGREATGLEAEAHALRLELAGQLREAVWAVALAEVEYRLARQREDDVRALERDVSRRVRAGERARTDLLFAQDEVLSARQVVLEKAAELEEAQRVYETLTGVEELPTATEESVADTPPPHPDLEATQTATDVAEARVRLAGRTLDERPQLILGARRERPAFNVDTENSIQLGFRIPLGGDRFRRPEVAAAHAELVTVATAQARTSDRIAVEIQTARETLELETARLNTAGENQAIVAEHYALVRQSFALGHSDLLDLFRVRALATAAELEFARQQVRLSRARARLNQAQGVLP